MPYPVILNGDHAEFESEWAASGKPDNERPDWPLPSFDAQDWAADFCKIATNLDYRNAEGSPIDEGWMIGWFANALMRGYDERSGKQPNLADLRGAVARGWCTEVNRHKEMDSDLAEAIVQEILLAQP